MKRKTWLLVCVLCLFVGSYPVQAQTTQEKILEKELEKQETKKDLKDTKDNLSGLKDKQSSLKGTLNDLNNQLDQVSSNLEDLEAKIAAKEADIEETTNLLNEAIAVADEQYASMKKRIQYMYEQGDFGFVETMLQARSFSEMINYVDYVEALSRYDRKMLTQYRNTRDEIDAKEKQLETEKAELLDYRVKVEAEQSRVSGLVSSTSNSIAQKANEIAEAEAEAEKYEQLIKQQEKDIAALKKKLAEELAMSKLASQASKRDISQVTFAEGDRTLLANLIYCEAGGEPYAGQLAVGAVVINRLLSSVYPDTVTGVIYQNGQFSPAKSGRLAIALASNKANASCYQAADEAMSGVSNVGNCVYFRTPVEGLSGIAIGSHIFY